MRVLRSSGFAFLPLMRRHIDDNYIGFAPAGYAPRKFLRRDPERQRVRLPALLRSRRCDQHSNIGHGYYATPPANDEAGLTGRGQD